MIMVEKKEKAKWLKTAMKYKGTLTSPEALQRITGEALKVMECGSYVRRAAQKGGNFHLCMTNWEVAAADFLVGSETGGELQNIWTALQSKSADAGREPAPPSAAPSSTHTIFDFGTRFDPPRVACWVVYGEPSPVLVRAVGGVYSIADCDGYTYATDGETAWACARYFATGKGSIPDKTQQKQPKLSGERGIVFYPISAAKWARAMA